MGKTYKIAVVKGDGIGSEIVPAGVSVLEAVAAKHNFSLDTTDFSWGAGHYLKHGEFMPSDGIEQLKAFDAIYFGAVGLPAVDDTLPARDYTFKVRTQLEQYVNYRPVKLFSGVKSPLRDKTEKDIDFVILRENNEGEFVQNGKILYPDTPNGVAVDTSMVTRLGVERIAHYAFKLARKRRKHVTNVTKSNTLIYTLGFWDKVIAEVAEQYPDVTYTKMYIDNASASFVLKPEVFDVIVTTNMMGDILSDLGGAIMGSLGLGGSGNINPENNFPSMFEPIHGSAPDIAGQNIANPIGQIWSAAIMLEHLGESEAAQDILAGIEHTTAKGNLTKDLKGNATTSEVAESVVAFIKAN
ncbi:tartrate dehydrogenase [Zobellia galactanivorans]|uniref:3-isopropylmalate dehydrogenase n=1 Tax=Zobellia galactanivorans (strain DSM 12802 / CCUG 47099 / CIP 106680 / NCIMB 13871 / Dsij) TaxID=63186 RepID=G0L845_ZOBGA|nr:tartrate dehydrogenase [Zobellia galactanivorans]MDO6807552.1 tartrate dehydrogenase [Zobellia galactanivorans]CAZ97936.1 Tartrate dehydrogenase/decarboxylase [Zobellia galactanivorans]